MTRRARLLAAAVGAALVAASAASATFTSSAVGGPQALSSAALAAPTGLTGSCSNSIVTLSWTATASTFATGHEVLRGTTSGGPYTLLATVTPRTTTTRTDATVNGLSVYYYVVRAYFGNWRSAYSNQVAVDSSNC